MIKTLSDIDYLMGKRVFVRVDFNVPLDREGNIRDDKRIRHAIPTIKYLLEEGVNQLILVSHLGRPKNNEPKLKSNNIAAALSELLDEAVVKVDDWGENGLPKVKIIMLENIRFHPSEKSKNEAERDSFGQHLASLADFYVNEAFSNSHRKHASMTSVPKYIPGCVGLGVEKEVAALTKAISSPIHPVVAVIGGLKADKINAIYNLMGIADRILVAGALACNLLKAKGYEIGSSKADDEGMEENADMVKEVIESEKVELPVDFVVADEFSDTANIKTVRVDGIEPGWMALDIGPESAENFAQQISKARTVLWFGPIGVFEMKPFSHGTKAIGKAISESSAMSIVGGGDSASAVKKLGLEDKITLVSTGGGASLEMIEGKKLPALEILCRSWT